jgi:hypothetical protein
MRHTSNASPPVRRRTRMHSFTMKTLRRRSCGRVRTTCGDRSTLWQMYVQHKVAITCVQIPRLHEPIRTDDGWANDSAHRRACLRCGRQTTDQVCNLSIKYGCRPGVYSVFSTLWWMKVCSLCARTHSQVTRTGHTRALTRRVTRTSRQVPTMTRSRTDECS